MEQRQPVSGRDQLVTGTRVDQLISATRATSLIQLRVQFSTYLGQMKALKPWNDTQQIK